MSHTSVKGRGLASVACPRGSRERRDSARTRMHKQTQSVAHAGKPGWVGERPAAWRAHYPRPQAQEKSSGGHFSRIPQSWSLGHPRASAVIDHLGAPHTSWTHVASEFFRRGLGARAVRVPLCGQPRLPWMLVATSQSGVSGLRGFAGFRPSARLQPFREETSLSQSHVMEPCQGGRKGWSRFGTQSQWDKPRGGFPQASHPHSGVSGAPTLPHAGGPGYFDHLLETTPARSHTLSPTHPRTHTLTCTHTRTNPPASFKRPMWAVLSTAANWGSFPRAYGIRFPGTDLENGGCAHQPSTGTACLPPAT